MMKNVILSMDKKYMLGLESMLLILILAVYEEALKAVLALFHMFCN